MEPTDELRYMLYLTGCAALGRKAQPPPHRIDWDETLSLARRHRLQWFVAFALKISGNLGCPGELRARTLDELYRAAGENCLQRQKLTDFLEELEAAGFSCAVLKGFAAALNYAAPDCRIGGDVDLWIDPEKEDAALNWLRGRGCAIEEPDGTSHHSLVRHPELAWVEFHRMLYAARMVEVWGLDGPNRVTRPCEPLVRCRDGFLTLGPTDHLLFITMHSVKHFVMLTFGLRMILDVAVIHRALSGSADMGRYWSVVRGARCETFVRTLLGIGQEYFGISATTEVNADPEEMRLVLESSDERYSDPAVRLSVVEAYRCARHTEAHGSVWYRAAYLRSFLPAAFVSKAQMTGKYPVLEKRPWLLPFLQLHRLATRGTAIAIRVLRGKAMAGDRADAAVNARTELYRRLGMI
jgi:hypothetical protein